MNTRSCICGIASILIAVPVLATPPSTGRIRNEKVAVFEQTLAPGEALSFPADRAGVLVYLDDGSIALTSAPGHLQSLAVKRGDTVFQPPHSGAIKYTGSAALRIVWTEFLGKGSSETWGTTGLAPHYKLLFENQYVRAYDARIAAGTSEPQHTHHDRVVVCLSGAELEHEMPDGRKETSSLKTGEVVWRRGQTHVGHNFGKTDLWVIAIEPK